MITSLKQHTVITVNQRLAQYLRNHYTEWQIQQHAQTWPAADIIPWHAWLERTWLQLLANHYQGEQRLLLNPLQVQAIWQNLLNENTDAEIILGMTQSTVNDLLTAWEMCCSHTIALNKIPDYSAETRLFLTLAKDYQYHCAEHQLLDPNLLPNLITAAVPDLILDKPISFVGFDYYTPQQQQLQQALRQQGHSVHTITDEMPPAPMHRYVFHDSETELRTAATWIKQQRQQNENIRIACVIPDLSARRDSVNRIFSEILAPESLFDLNTTALRPFNISAGEALPSCPLIRAALNLLQLQLYENSFNLLSALLRSPFLGGSESELFRRANLDTLLRKMGNPNLSLKSLFAHAKQEADEYTPLAHCPILAQQLERVIQLLSDMPRRVSASDWANHFLALLNAMGWPGERVLNSVEHQQRSRFLELLQHYMHLDYVSGPLTRPHALQLLQQLISNTIFQPQTPTSNIQILGILETAGLQFDYIWLLSINDEQWPPAAKPNPFLPREWQRQLNLPHASLQREYLFCQSVQQRLAHSCQQLIISHYSHDNDRILLASPLIGALPIESLSIELTPRLTSQLKQDVMLEMLNDEMAPPIEPAEIPGLAKAGTALLKEQAACPFRAYATFRLGARPLEQPHLGLDPRERGTLIHTIVEKIWQVLLTQQHLQTLDADALQKIIQTHVQTHLQRATQEKLKHTQTIFLQLEQYRLEKLIFQWLWDFERQRAPFSVIATEQRDELRLGELTLHVKIDRIDQLEDGQRVIIDYKASGQAKSISVWFGERPDEPQLPLYASFSSLDIDGILFSQIFSGRYQYSGICRDEHALGHSSLFSHVITPTAVNKKIKMLGTDIQSWQDLQNYWLNQLQQLGNDFSSGNAKVDPKETTDTCRLCPLPTLCRIASHATT